MIYIAAAKTEYFLIKQSKISISIALNHIAGLFVRNFNSILIIDHKMICNSLETYYVAHDIEIKSKYQSYFKNLIGELNVGLILIIIYSHNEMEKKYLILFSFFTYFSYLHIKTNIYRQKQKWRKQLALLSQQI